MGTAQATYFREEVAKPSQVIVAASNPETLRQLAKAKSELMRNQLKGIWIALGAMTLGATAGALLYVINVWLPATALGAIVFAGVIALGVAALFADMLIAIVVTLAGMLILFLLVNNDGVALQAVAFSIVACAVTIPKWLPVIHGAAHANRFSSSVTNLLYTLEGALHSDFTGDGIIGQPDSAIKEQGNVNTERSAPIETSTQRQIPITVNGEQIDVAEPVPHVVTYQVLSHPFDTTRSKGLYTPQQARDFWMLLSSNPKYMDRNQIQGKELSVGVPPRRIRLTKQAHDDLKAGLYGIGVITRVGPRYVLTGKTRREVTRPIISHVAASGAQNARMYLVGRAVTRSPCRPITSTRACAPLSSRRSGYLLVLTL